MSCCTTELAAHPPLRLTYPGGGGFVDGRWVDDGGQGYWEFFPRAGQDYAQLYCVRNSWVLEYNFDPLPAIGTVACDPFDAFFDAGTTDPWFAQKFEVTPTPPGVWDAGLTLFIQGAPVTAGPTLFVDGVAGTPDTGGLTLVVPGKDASAAGATLYVCGPVASASGLKLAVTGSAGVADAGLALSVEGRYVPGTAGSLTLVTGGVVNPAAGGLKLFVSGPDHTPAASGLKLAVSGKNPDRAAGVPLVVPGDSPDRAAGVPLFLKVSPVGGGSDRMDLYLRTPEAAGVTFVTAGPSDPAAGGVTLAVAGAQPESQGVPLAVPAAHAPAHGSQKMFVSGF
jgi:hypothetical protein